MPNTTSAKKRLRQNVTRRTRNRAIKSSLRTQTRKVRELVAAGNIASSETEFRKLTKQLDQAAAKGAIHPNRASRVKSRVSARIKAAKGKG